MVGHAVEVDRWGAIRLPQIDDRLTQRTIFVVGEEPETVSNDGPANTQADFPFLMDRRALLDACGLQLRGDVAALKPLPRVHPRSVPAERVATRLHHGVHQD